MVAERRSGVCDHVRTAHSQHRGSTLASIGVLARGGVFKGCRTFTLLVLTITLRTCLAANTTASRFGERVLVTDHAMGARCAVAADFDGDGRMDLVSASSNDNAVSWFRNLGMKDGTLSFATKQKITWSSLGSRIVTVGDLDGDGDLDVIGASYYDSAVRWFENNGAGAFKEHVISTAVNEGQVHTITRKCD